MTLNDTVTEIIQAFDLVNAGIGNTIIYGNRHVTKLSRTCYIVLDTGEIVEHNGMGRTTHVEHG